MKPAQPLSVTIRRIEFELEKAEHGMGLPYDAERVGQLRSMLREARKAETVPRAGGETGAGSAMTAPNFARLDADRPEVSRLRPVMVSSARVYGRRMVGRGARGPSCPPTYTRQPQPWRSEHLPATGRAT